MVDQTAILVHQLAEAGLSIATAESLTGGLLAAELVRIPGASRVFTGGVVAYSAELKQRLLGVNGDLIARSGTVNPGVACALADGARRVCGVAGRAADIGLSTTGVAGPGSEGGVSPGTVFVGIAMAYGTRSVALNFIGDRNTIRALTVDAAITHVRQELERKMWSPAE